MTKRVGAFVCHCGGNISETVDVKKVLEGIKGCECVVDDFHICSEEGQNKILEKIKENNLDAIVIGACSDRMHVEAFRKLAKQSGISPYNVERVNLREHDSWIHTDDPENATKKATSMMNGGVSAVFKRGDIQPKRQSIKKSALIIGGGISGMTAALELPSDMEVILVEKEPSIGGKMAQIVKLFPTFDCSQCAVLPKMVEVSQKENVKILTNSVLEEVSGSPGQFKVKIKQLPRYVDESKCVACGACSEACPVKVPDSYNLGMSERKAIYMYHKAAIPSAYVRDPEKCVECNKCVEACNRDAINLEDTEKIHEFEVGAILLATGYELFDISNLKRYGYGKYPNVITSMEIERMMAADGPSGGYVYTPSNREERPTSVAYLLCIGSRDENNGYPHCSKICCMYALKQARLLTHLIKDGKIWIYYTDIRAAGKDYEEFYAGAQKEGITFNRGKATEVYGEDGKLVVRAENTLTGEMLENDFDLVVLCPALIGSPGNEEIARKMDLSLDKANYFIEKHPKLSPVDMNIIGCYASGTALGPRDIHDTIVDSLSAAARINSFLGMGEIEIEPRYVEITDACDGCGKCDVLKCGAIKIENGKAMVDLISCNGCGYCIPECEKKAIDYIFGTDDEIMAQIDGILGSDDNAVLCFAESEVPYSTIDRIASNKLKYPANIRVIPIRSVGRIGVRHVLHAFKQGALGVILLHGPELPEDKKKVIRERTNNIKRELVANKIQTQRFRISEVFAPQHAKLSNLFTVFAEMAAKAGPLDQEIKDNIKE